MKTLTATLIAFFLVTVVSAVWYSSNTTLSSGTYSAPGWGQTMTIAANSNVTFTGSVNFASGHLVLQENSTLTINNALQANGTITLAPGSTLIINGALTTNTTVQVNGGTLSVTGNISQSGPLTVSYGGHLNVGGTLSSNNGGITIQDGGNLQANNLTLNGTNSFAGLVNVTQTLRINGGNNSFSGCGEFRTQTLLVANGNLINGNGFVVVSQTYNNGSNSGWPGHPLTNSNTIGVYYAGSATNASFGTAHMSATSTNPCRIVLSRGFGKFSAVQQLNNYFQLEWNAPESDETNRYEIQVSEDGVNFKTIEVVPANSQRGSGVYRHKVMIAE